MEPLTLKVVIAFFYMMNGNLVSYTISDYESFAAEEKIPPELTCTTLIRNVGFMESVRSGLAKGESMRAACYTTDDLMELGEPDASAHIAHN